MMCCHKASVHGLIARPAAQGCALTYRVSCVGLSRRALKVRLGKCAPWVGKGLAGAQETHSTLISWAVVLVSVAW